jgi:hypothetical protein
LQIESEVNASGANASAPLLPHWAFPPISVPSPPSRSASQARLSPMVSSNVSGEVIDFF